MTIFWMTWKASGWPIERLQSLLDRFQRDGTAEEPWRIQAHRQVTVGDQALLFKQGQGPKGIFGVGEIVGPPRPNASESRNPLKPQYFVPIRFTQLVNPQETLLLEDEPGKGSFPSRLVKANASGTPLKREEAERFRALVEVDGDPSPTNQRNPPWSRDELILALDLYHQVNGRFPGERDPAVVHLSEQLNALHRALGTTESTTLRNPNGVAMKLMNFRRFDPRALNEGRSGLTRGNKLEQEIWELFQEDHGRLRAVAQAILADLEAHPSGDLGAASDPLLSDTEEAPEGRVLTVTHLRRERSRELVRSKKNRVMSLKGKLECEACGFDFATRYGQHGHGFIECHHTKPVETLVEGHKTRLEDLALLCANCHRMIHARRPWLSVEGLRGMLDTAT